MSRSSSIVSVADLEPMHNEYNCDRIYWSPDGTQSMCHYSVLGGDIVIFRADVSKPYVLYENVARVWCGWAPYDGRYIDCHYNEQHQWWVTIIYDADTKEAICGYDMGGAYDMHHRKHPCPECQALPLADGKWWHVAKECGSWGRGENKMIVTDSPVPPLPDPARVWCTDSPNTEQESD